LEKFLTIQRPAKLAMIPAGLPHRCANSAKSVLQTNKKRPEAAAIALKFGEVTLVVNRTPAIATHGCRKPSAFHSISRPSA
jgi:hypothetical protein